MEASLISMNNEANRIASERLLEQLRDEGLHYRLWVTGTPAGDTLHMRVERLSPELHDRIDKVMRGRGLQLDIAANCSMDPPQTRMSRFRQRSGDHSGRR